MHLNNSIENKTKKDVEGVKACLNPMCHHSGNEHYSPLHLKSAGDLMDSSCTLCPCEKFEEA